MSYFHVFQERYFLSYHVHAVKVWEFVGFILNKDFIS